MKQQQRQQQQNALLASQLRPRLRSDNETVFLEFIVWHVRPCVQFRCKTIWKKKSRMRAVTERQGRAWRTEKYLASVKDDGPCSLR